MRLVLSLALAVLPAISYAQVYSPCGDWPYTPCPERDSWNWHSAAAVYGGGILLDRLTTERFLRHGVAEGNPYGQSPWARTGLNCAALGVYMGADYMAHRYVHPRAVWPLRVGLGIFYLRQGYVNVTVVR